MEVVPEVRFQGDLPAQSTLLVEVKSRVPQVSSSSKPGCGRQRKSSYLNECRDTVLDPLGDGMFPT